jgi:predicted phosphohydrolase
MTIWAISDLHLAFSVPEKSMEAFGPSWKDYAAKIQMHWQRLVSPEDLVLIAGDISWAMRLEEALKDLLWIEALPGKKIILRGNHDYWWQSPAKMAKVMPPSIQFLQNNALKWNNVAIGGSRLWDTPEYHFNDYIEFQENPRARPKTSEGIAKEKEEGEKIFTRELQRLRLSLSQLDNQAAVKIAMVHYPPVDALLHPSRASQILEEFQINFCVFGHLHNVRKNALPFGKARGVNYLFTSCDYLEFAPIKVISLK